MEENLIWLARALIGGFIFSIGYYLGKARGLSWGASQNLKTMMMYDQYIEQLKKGKR